MLKLIGIFGVVLFLLFKQRIPKYGEVENICVTPDKKLNIFIY